QGLADAVGRYDLAFPGRFYTFTEPSYSRFTEPDYPKLEAQAIEQAHRSGARGLKILKTLGLYLRENITSGTLVKIDDPRFDPMWILAVNYTFRYQFTCPIRLHSSLRQTVSMNATKNSTTTRIGLFTGVIFRATQNCSKPATASYRGIPRLSLWCCTWA